MTFLKFILLSALINVLTCVIIALFDKKDVTQTA